MCFLELQSTTCSTKYRCRIKMCSEEDEVLGHRSLDIRNLCYFYVSLCICGETATLYFEWSIIAMHCINCVKNLLGCLCFNLRSD